MSSADLATFLHAQRHAWLQRWRERVLGTAPAPPGARVPGLALDAHVPALIDSVIEQLRGAGAPAHARGAPGYGSAGRADGHDIGEVVGGLSVLRAAAVELLEAQPPAAALLHGPALRALNGAFDRLIADAVDAYAVETNEAMKRQQAAHLAFVAHDLRTPLGAISLAVQALRRTLPLADEADIAARMLRSLERNVAQLTRLVDHVPALGLAGAEAVAVPPLQLRRVELRGLVHGLLQGLEAQARAAGARLVVDIPANLEVQADPTLLARALQNLVVNAIEYASPGVVEIGASRQGEHLRCEVRDQGPGIPAGRLPHLFERVDAVDVRADDDGPAHRGFGLAIARQFTEAHGGRIGVHSGATGTVFHLELPLRGPAR